MDSFTPLETANRASRGRIIVLAIIAGVLLAFVLVAVVLAVVIPKQISYLEYYEYGLKREKSTGLVSLDKVYKSGRHWLGQDYDFFVYSANVQHLYLENITTFSKERLQVKWNLRMQYFIRSDELTDLYTNFNTNVTEYIKGIATNELKTIATTFGILDRLHIEKRLHKALRERVGGRCCRPNCNQTDYELDCYSGCILREFCEDTDKGLHVDIKYIQLGMANIPSSVLSRYLVVLTLPENIRYEEYVQEATLIRKDTDMMVRHIKMETEEFLSNATTRCKFVIESAKSEYTSILEQANILGHQNSIRQFNITEEEKTESLVYLQPLIDQGTFRPNTTFVHYSGCD